jgi:hypothetical protein
LIFALIAFFLFLKFPTVRAFTKARRRNLPCRSRIFCPESQTPPQSISFGPINGGDGKKTSLQSKTEKLRYQ